MAHGLCHVVMPSKVIMRLKSIPLSKVLMPSKIIKPSKLNAVFKSPCALKSLEAVKSESVVKRYCAVKSLQAAFAGNGRDVWEEGVHRRVYTCQARFHGFTMGERTLNAD